MRCQALLQVERLVRPAHVSGLVLYAEEKDPSCRVSKGNDRLERAIRGGQIALELEGLLNSPWKRARTQAGLANATIHDLRRTCATRLRDAGVDSETRRDILGHTPERSDMARLYATPTLQRLFEAVEKLCEPPRGLSLVKQA